MCGKVIISMRALTAGTLFRHPKQFAQTPPSKSHLGAHPSTSTCHLQCMCCHLAIWATPMWHLASCCPMASLPLGATHLGGAHPNSTHVAKRANKWPMSLNDGRPWWPNVSCWPFGANMGPILMGIGQNACPTMEAPTAPQRVACVGFALVPR